VAQIAARDEGRGIAGIAGEHQGSLVLAPACADKHR
jgi:hypothetical protein